MKCIALLLLMLAWVPSSRAQGRQHWVSTWAAAPVSVPNPDGAGLPLGRQAVTLSQTVHLDLGGKHLRVLFTNEFGTTPLTIASAVLSVNGERGPKCLPLSSAQRRAFTIAPGSVLTSDVVDAATPRFSDVTITLSLPRQELPALTIHPNANATSIVETTPGPIATAAPAACVAPSAEAKDILKPGVWFFLKSVQVETPDSARTLVAFGDSITDGFRSTPNDNRRYPDFLARRLATYEATSSFSVVNEGISGNRVMSDVSDPPFGVSAQHRFANDVLAQPAVRSVLLLEGINDITNSGVGGSPEHDVSADQIVDGLEDLARQAHSHGLRVLVGTLMPFGGLSTTTESREKMREDVNVRLRSSKAFDAVVDFDAVVRDPDKVTWILPRFDSGDHIHPNDAGYQAMANAVDLSKL